MDLFENGIVKIDDIRYMAKRLYGMLPTYCEPKQVVLDFSYSSPNVFSEITQLENPIFATSVMVSKKGKGSKVFVSASADNVENEKAFEVGNGDILSCGSLWRFIQVTGDKNGGDDVQLIVTGYELGYAFSPIPIEKAFIEGSCNVVNDTFTFNIYLTSTGYVTRTANTDSQGYWRYLLTDDEITSIRGLEGFATSISQSESDKLVSVKFSSNFPFGQLNVRPFRCLFGSYASTYFGCRNLTKIEGWKLTPQENITAYQSILSYCTSLADIDISTLRGNKGSSYSTIFRRVPASKIVGLRQFMEDSEPSDFSGAFDYCANITNVSIPTLKNNVNTNNSFRQCTSLTTIDYCGDISTNIDIRNSPLNLASAILILQHLQDVTSYGGKTITFSSTTSALVQADTTAMNLVAQAQSYGWTITGF